MDSTDLKIVSMLKKNARVSASAIAKEVGLAVSSVTERIRRLEEAAAQEPLITTVPAEQIVAEPVLEQAQQEVQQLPQALRN